MKKYFKSVMLFLFLAFSLKSIAQENKANTEKKPFIEVEASAEKEIVPNEIYIEILLKEREEGRNKMKIAEQEKTLLDGIKKLGIAASNLTLADARADYGHVKMFKKGVTTRKIYELKLSSATLVGQVFEMLDAIQIQDAEIVRVNHTEIQQYRKETRIEAIKAAKDKADYLLEAIGEERGKALEIKELNKMQTNLRYQEDMYSLSNVSSLETVVVSNELKKVAFKKIKVQFSYFIRYEIK